MKIILSPEKLIPVEIDKTDFSHDSNVGDNKFHVKDTKLLKSYKKKLIQLKRIIFK